MVIIESNLIDGFETVMGARDFVLVNGFTINPDRVVKIFEENNLMNDEIEKILVDREISAKEKYYVLKSKVGNFYKKFKIYNAFLRY